jgi:hypothetical protein
MTSNNLQSMQYTNEGGYAPQLKVLDQLLIPHEKVYIDVPDVDMAYTVIKTMQIRGKCVPALLLRYVFADLTTLGSLVLESIYKSCLISDKTLKSSSSPFNCNIKVHLSLPL